MKIVDKNLGPNSNHDLKMFNVDFNTENNQDPKKNLNGVTLILQ